LCAWLATQLFTGRANVTITGYFWR